jgi:hypothetical protein
MNSQELIAMASSSWNMAHLLDKLGGHKNTRQNRINYLHPLLDSTGLTMTEVASYFASSKKLENNAEFPTATPEVTPTSTPTN